jgi:hypothetical protein
VSVGEPAALVFEVVHFLPREILRAAFSGFTPTGLRLTDQGCEALRATLGGTHDNDGFTPTGLHHSVKSRRRMAQPRRG